MKETQTHKIITWLRNGNNLTPLEALKYFGCFRLAARIHDLKQKGYDIRCEMVTVGDATVARYRLFEEMLDSPGRIY